MRRTGKWETFYEVADERCIELFGTTVRTLGQDNPLLANELMRDEWLRWNREGNR